MATATDNGDLLGSFEQLVVLAIIRLKEAAYGMTVRQEIQQCTGRTISLGAVYATLDRLESKGYISTRKGSATAERQGRAKRFFRVESAGSAALRQSLRVIENMRAGIPGLKRQLGGMG